MKTTLLLTALMSASALAQEPAPPPPPPPQPIVSRPADAPMLTDQDPGGRFRWGVSGNIGWNIPTPAFVGGAEVHLGWQLSNMFSVYGILGTHFGLGFNASVTGSSARGGITAFGAYYGGAIAEIMLADVFYVGGGALAGSGGFAGIQVGANTSGGQSVQTLAQGGFMFGFDARLGLNFSKPHPAPSFRRGGFNFGIDVMAILRPNTVIVTESSDASGNFAAGVTTNTLTATVMPMLTLGYDAR